LRPRLDESAILELVQRLQHGRHRQAALARQPPHRRQSLAGPQVAGGDDAAQILGQFLVAQRFGFHSRHQYSCPRSRQAQLEK
jgi:hypothetical protein